MPPPSSPPSEASVGEEVGLRAEFILTKRHALVLSVHGARHDRDEEDTRNVFGKTTHVRQPKRN